MLVIPFDFKDGSARGILHQLPNQPQMIFNLSLSPRPRDARAFRETARLCNFINGHLPAGRFCLDHVDGEISFRNAHFYGPDGLQPDAFRLFFEDALDSVAVALRVFSLVTNGSGTASEAMAVLLPPSAS